MDIWLFFLLLHARFDVEQRLNKNQISFPMKKHTIASFMLGAFCLTASAHKTVEGSLFFDNWSVGLNVGGVTTLNPDYPFGKVPVP